MQFAAVTGSGIALQHPPGAKGRVSEAIEEHTRHRSKLRSIRGFLLNDGSERDDAVWPELGALFQHAELSTPLTTIRGYAQDSVGPSDSLDPTGGQALFLTNNELRFPVVSIFDGVGFIDAGNVYSTVSDFKPWKVRSSAGLGLRVHTPYFLLRFDYGFKLRRRPGESIGAFFFSIGQAF